MMTITPVVLLLLLLLWVTASSVTGRDGWCGGRGISSSTSSSTSGRGYRRS